MEEDSTGTRSSTDSGTPNSQIVLDSFILNLDSILENIESEYLRIYKKDIKYTGYLGSSSKNFCNYYNFKIFKEINNEIDVILQKKTRYL
jgi:hypothetical protein